MLKVLINAYAVSPTWGSEPGMGWNWVSNLAKFCDLYIITEGEWQEDIERSVAAALAGDMSDENNPTKLTKEQADHMHFYYNNVSEEVRQMCWNQGDWRFYGHYAKWQEKTLEMAKEVMLQVDIDLVHQLNMIGYREPGMLWKITNKPMVWGPVGGYAGVPNAFLKGASMKEVLKENVKNVINWLSFRCLPRVRKAVKRADAVVGAYKETWEAIKKVYRPEAILINETGAFIDEASVMHASVGEEFKLLWVGKYDLRKQLGIAIKTIALLNDKPNIHLYVCGTGYDRDVEMYTQMVKDLGLEERVHLLGKVPNVKTRAMMKEMDVFFFTSIHDATSTVVPEAISAGLPVVCHNTRGYGVIVDDNIGRKIEVHNPERSAKDFADVIRKLEADREEVRRLSAGCVERQKSISWEANARKMVGQYELAIERFNNRKK